MVPLTPRVDSQEAAAGCRSAMLERSQMYEVDSRRDCTGNHQGPIFALEIQKRLDVRRERSGLRNPHSEL
jgi:hypothetical protein